MNASPIPPVIKELVVAVDPARAFEAFTAEVRSWWPVASHSVAGTDGLGLRLDPNGFVETLADGSETEWGAVLAWEPPHRLAMTWHPGNYPDPHTTVEVTFEAIEAGTLVRLVHSGWEALRLPDPEVAARRRNYTAGWDVVLGCYVDVIAAAGVA